MARAVRFYIEHARLRAVKPDPIDRTHAVGKPYLVPADILKTPEDGCAHDLVRISRRLTGGAVAYFDKQFWVGTSFQETGAEKYRQKTGVRFHQHSEEEIRNRLIK